MRENANMDSTVHEIDPDGDVLLILLNPNTPFAVWDESNEPCLFTAPDSCDTIVQVPNSSIKGNETTTNYDYLSFESVDPGSSSVSIFRSEPRAEPHAESVAQSPEDPLPEEGVEVHMRLSSKHLILASLYFKKMLQGPWKESNASENACYTINASEWDTQAMLILMNVLHGRVRSVPRSVSLEMLAKIAVLVDYYKCHEAVELFTDLWVQNLSRHLPREYGRDVVLWLTISWIFSQKVIFHSMTKLAVNDSKGPLQTLGLPMPQHIVETIDQRRQAIVDQVTSALEGLISYLYGRRKCSFECSSMLLGALARQMQTKGLLNPKPTMPFLGYSITEILKIVRELESPRWTHSFGRGSIHYCTLSPFTKAIISSFKDGIEGFQLDDF